VQLLVSSAVALSDIAMLPPESQHAAPNAAAFAGAVGPLIPALSFALLSKGLELSAEAPPDTLLRAAEIQIVAAVTAFVLAVAEPFPDVEPPPLSTSASTSAKLCFSPVLLASTAVTVLLTLPYPATLPESLIWCPEGRLRPRLRVLPKLFPFHASFSARCDFPKASDASPLVTFTMTLSTPGLASLPPPSPGLAQSGQLASSEVSTNSARPPGDCMPAVSLLRRCVVKDQSASFQSPLLVLILDLSASFLAQTSAWIRAYPASPFGVAVVTETDAEAAFYRCSDALRRDCPISILIADPVLTNALGLISRCRALPRRVQPFIIACSSYRHAAPSALSAGADLFLSKPLSRADFDVAWRSCLSTLVLR
jgi:CheY-like chemotaxis protein